jgi:type II secretory pathway component PulF
MAFFLVKFIGQEGTILTKRVEAVTQEEAISLSGVSDNVIQSVVVDHFGGIRAALTDRRLPMNEQVLALITLASKLESGKTLGRAILESVDFEKLGISREDLARCDLPAEYFKLLRFDETALLLADAGDRSGKLADSLKRAAETLRSSPNQCLPPFFTALLGWQQALAFRCLGGR